MCDVVNQGALAEVEGEGKVCWWLSWRPDVDVGVEVKCDLKGKVGFCDLLSCSFFPGNGGVGIGTAVLGEEKGFLVDWVKGIAWGMIVLTIFWGF